MPTAALARANARQVFGSTGRGSAAGNGRPARILISDRCAQTIEQLPALQHDDGKPDDVLKTNVDDDGQGGDDYADCLRYGVMLKKPSPIGLVRVGGY